QIGWLASIDPDPLDEITYTIEFYSDKNLTSTITKINTIQKSHLSPYAGTYQRISNWDRVSTLQNKNSFLYYCEGLKYILPKNKNEIIIQLNLYPEFKQLPENNKIYYQVRAIDKNALKSESSLHKSFYLNTKNEAPGKISQMVFPADSQIVKSKEFSLFWKAASDKDPGNSEESIIYHIQIQKENGKIINDSTSAGMTHWQLPFSAEENAKYNYKIRAIDAYGAASEWSKTFTFWVDAEVEAPQLQEEYLSINDTTIFSEAYPVIRWTNIKNVDPGSNNAPLKAEISINFPDQDDERIYLQDISSNYSFQDSLPFYDNSWGYFKIRIIRSDSIYSDWSNTIRFGNDFYPESPSSFNIISPVLGQDTLNTLPVFKWSASEDPDLNDELMYTIYISEDSTFYDDVIIIDAIYDTEYQLDFDEELYEGSRYFWKISVEDKQGNRAWGSQSDYIPWWFNVGEVYDDDTQKYNDG
ncbi:MAG: hypothetical protein KAI81_06240, partial [Candidatus Marinimicrobia bacterium]|nr:hypothetical protein [Candidatus Neomarinimicrobiota bacterium]